MKKLSIIMVLVLLVLSIDVAAIGPKIDKSIAIWNQNTETDLAGYNLYWRIPSGSFSDSNRVQVLPTDKVGTHPAPSFNLAGLNLAPGNYFIAVSAYDTAGNESGLSDDVPFDASVPSAPIGLGVVR